MTCSNFWFYKSHCQENIGGEFKQARADLIAAALHSVLKKAEVFKVAHQPVSGRLGNAECRHDV